MEKIKDFKELRIWQLGIDIVKSIYLISSTFPKSEQFGLTNQMRRASVSIPSNIAEGYIKSSQKDLNRFLDMSLGSCAELETQIIIAKELGYLKEIEYKNMMEKIIAEIKQITSLKNRIANS